MIGRLNAYVFWTRIVCNLLPLFAFVAAHAIRFGGYITYWTNEYEPRLYFGLLLVTTVVWSIVSEHYRLVAVDSLLESHGGVRRVVLAHFVTHTILFAFLFFYRWHSFSRVFFAVSAAILFGLTVSLRVALRALVRSCAFATAPVRLLVVGADEFAVRTTRRLTAAPNPPCRVVGYVQVQNQVSAAGDAAVFSVEELKDFVLGGRVDEVIVALGPAERQLLNSLMPELEQIGTPIRVAIDFGERIALREELLQIGDLRFAELMANTVSV